MSRHDREPDVEPTVRRASAAALTDALKREATRLGFAAAGITQLRPSEHAEFFRRWIEEGRHGEMAWLARDDAVRRRLDPVTAWPDLSSVLVVADAYSDGSPDAEDPSRAIIARYARGRDYHPTVKKKLLALLRWLEAETGRAMLEARAYVDTGPVLEREVARSAGLGWFGRNTMLIHPRRGSYFFLAALILPLELPEDAPFDADHCGTCSACVDACPTGALLGRDDDGAPVIDARRCISYLTIEHRGAIPVELRPLIGNRVFGCDICQEVCPYPRKFSSPCAEPSFAARGPGEPPVGVEKRPSDGWHPGTRSPSLIDLMALDEAGWEAFSRGSALRRAGRAGFLRNVAVALGNWGSEEAVPVLVSALSDADRLVRGHAAWALGEVGSPEAFDALESRVSSEDDPFVRSELDAALDRSRPKAK